MIKFGKKIRQTLTMLLAVSMLAGSVPLNAFAMEAESGMELTEVAVVSENTVNSEEYLDNIGPVEVAEELPPEESVPEKEEFLAETEEQAVSGNTIEETDEIIATETGEKVEVTFSVLQDIYTSYVKIIQIDEENLETEVSGHKVLAEVGKPLKFRLEIAEGYKVTNVTIGNSIVPQVDGVYTAYPAAAGNIEIAVSEVEKYDVTFDYDEELVTDLKVKMGKKDVTLQENVATDMWEGSTVSFTLTLDNMAKVVKVTANEEELKAVDGTTYELQDLTEEVEIKIETSLDRKKCNTLDIVVWGHRNSISVLNDGEMYVHGECLLTKDSNEEITVYLDNNYVVDKILLNNVEKKFTGTNTSYSISFSKENKNQTLVIYTTPKVSAEKKKIVFANKASNVTYEVNRKDPANPDRIIVEKDAYKNNTYTVSANEILMEFSVTSKDGYEPNVTIPEGVLYDVTANGNIRTYSVAVATLGNEQNPTEIIIEEIAQMRTISVAYDANSLETLKAIIDGVYTSGEKGYDGDKKLNIQKFIVTHGTDIILELKTVQGYTVGAIKELNEDEVLKVVKPGKEEYQYTIKADKDKTVELQLDGIYVTGVYDVWDEENFFEIKEEKGIYSVEAGRKYKVNLYKGKDRVSVSAAVLKSGTKVLKDQVKVVDSENVYVEIPDTEAGKSLTLELSCREGTQTHTHVMKMKALPEVKITKITGVKSGKLSQTADTVKEYKFTSNIVFTEGQFGVEVVTAKAEEDIINEEERNKLNEAARAAFQAELKEDILKITVKTSAEGERAYVKFYDVSKSTAGQKHYINGGAILVTAKAPAFHKKATPSVSLKSATNLNLILNLGMKNVEEIENGEYWYKIEGTPKYTSKTDESVIDNTEEFVQYVKYTGASQVACVQAISGLSEGEMAYKADFDIKVTFMQTKDQNEPMESQEDSTDGNVAFCSKTSAKKTMSTKVPAYETKLGIKMVTKTVYTGQQNVVVATPVFSKATTYQQISCVAKEEGIEVNVDEDNRIVVSVAGEVEPGDYTVEVTAQAAENTMAAVKEFTFKVAQGIYEITLDTPKELYKGYKKKATLKVGISYNEKDEEKQPQSKKVEWSLQDVDEVDIDKEHPMYEIFTIKNGVITIDEKFIVSQEEEENTFRVKAVAMDCEREEGDEVVGYSEWITISNKKITLGDLVLVESRETEDGIVYDVVARSGQDAPIDKVDGSQLVILHKGTPERDTYTEEDFMYGVEEEGEEEEKPVLVYTGNQKAIKINQDKTVTAEQVAKGVKIVAQTEDGSGVKTELSNINIVYAKAGELGIEVRNSENQMTIADTYVNSTTEFYGAKDQALTLKIQEKIKGNSEDAYGRDYELKVTGAKIVKKERVAGVYQLVATSDTIVIQVVNNTTEDTKIFTLENAAFANKEVKNSKAVTLKTEGTLKTGELTEEQTIVYTLPKESIGKYTHAWVTVDKLDYLNEKKTEYYDALIAASNGAIGSLQQLGSDGKVSLTFKVPEEAESYCIPDTNFTYKLNISFGTMTENYEFVAQVKSNAVTIKTKEDKMSEAPLQSSYAISAKEDGSALMTLKNKGYSLLNVEGVMNKNVKGVQNRFGEYFEVVKEELEDGSFKFYICLKSGIDVSEIRKTDLEGYIGEYTFTNGNKTKTVYNAAVKVSFKDLVRKYSLTKAVVLLEDEESVNTNVKIFAGNEEAAAEWIYVPQNQKFEADINGDGSLNLQSKGDATIKSSNKCTIYMLPVNSCYISRAEELLNDFESSEGSEASFLKKLGKYAIKLTADITVKDKAKATGKIKFASKDLKVKLTSESYADGTYQVEIPYSRVTELEVESFTNQSEESIVSVSKSTEDDKVILRLEKRALLEAYAKDAKIYGKTITVKAVAEFGQDTKEEMVTFKVTLPKKPVQLQQAVDALKKIVWSELPIQYKGLSKEEIEAVNGSLILEKAAEVFSVDGELSAELQELSAQPSTKDSEGKIIGNLVVTDGIKGEKKKVEIAITLAKLLTEPEELESNLQDAIGYCEGRKITNLTTLSGILTTVRSRVGISNYKNLRLYAKDTKITPATLTNAGSISGVFCIIDITNKDAAQLEVPFALEIPQLMTMEQAAEEIKVAVEEIVLYNKDLLNVNKGATIDKILKIAQEVLVGQDYFVELKRGTTLNGTPAEGVNEGSASIQLEIVYLTTERLFKDITCTMQVLETKE